MTRTETTLTAESLAELLSATAKAMRAGSSDIGAKLGLSTEYVEAVAFGYSALSGELRLLANREQGLALIAADNTPTRNTPSAIDELTDEPLA